MTPVVATLALTCCALLVRAWWLAIDRDVLVKLLEAERRGNAQLRERLADARNDNLDLARTNRRLAERNVQLGAENLQLAENVDALGKQMRSWSDAANKAARRKLS